MKTQLPLPMMPWDMDWVWLGLKWLYVLVGVLFVIFGLVLLAQLKQMTNAYRREFHQILILIGVGFLALAAGSLVLALLVL
jgi:hypothetical protein